MSISNFKNKEGIDSTFKEILFELKSKKEYSNLQNILLTIIKDFKVYESYNLRKKNSKNPFNKYGRKCFSQSDEDGLTFEIIKRLDIKKGNFAEFGVGNGLENNTLLLLALGWKGFWVGSEDLMCDYKNSANLQYYKRWITLDNILDITSSSMKNLKIRKLDLISLDLDGNDFYFCQKLLTNFIYPKLFIIEYNAKLFPPIEFVVDYNHGNTWKLDDYFGASIQSFNNLFKIHGYKLVCCNSNTGSNAFFVKKEFKNLFKDVPEDINDIYMEPNYDLPFKYGHPSSAKLVNNILKK